MKLLPALVGSLIAGIIVGHFGSPNFGDAYEWALYVLIFLIGVDLGLNFSVDELKSVGKGTLALPFLTLLGSILGGLVAALLLGIAPKWGLAIGAGCGWYSLVGPLIAQYSPVYGAVGFLSNMMREILTIILYPWLAKVLGARRAVPMGGATTMDTTLAVMSRFGGRDVALVAFVHGFILTAVIPFVVPLLLGS